MFSLIRRHLSYANVVATMALVFAMSGGALAASHYLITKTTQIKPSVLKTLKGKTGPAGPKGSTAAAGIVVFTVTPSVSATKALKQALEKQHGLGVTALLSYQSARGGSPASRTVSVEDKLAKPKTKRAK